MLRRLLLYLSSAGWARQIVMRLPLARRVALRFVAGETLDAAVQKTAELNRRGIHTTLNYLGESVKSAEETVPVVQTYNDLLEQIHQNHLQASVSVKLTHLGLDISEALCHNNLRHILTTAKKYDVPLTIDMESSDLVDVTLRLYRTMRDEYDFQNVGTVIQSYLRRSAADMRQLAAENAHIRLVKGAYLESPEVAYPEKADVDEQFKTLAAQYLESSAYLCIATHDENIIQHLQQVIDLNGVPTSQYEYQMLLGVRMAWQAELAQAGYTVRAYVPFGEAWYPYFMRRLAERPANLWFFVRSLFAG